MNCPEDKLTLETIACKLQLPPWVKWANGSGPRLQPFVCWQSQTSTSFPVLFGNLLPHPFPAGIGSVGHYEKEPSLPSPKLWAPETWTAQENTQQDPNSNPSDAPEVLHWQPQDAWLTGKPAFSYRQMAEVAALGGVAGLVIGSTLPTLGEWLLEEGPPHVLGGQLAVSSCPSSRGLEIPGLPSEFPVHPSMGFPP